MNRPALHWPLTLLLAAFSAQPMPAIADDKTEAPETHKTAGAFVPAAPDARTSGAVTVNGQVIQYDAVAGTLTVGSTDALNAMLTLDGAVLPTAGLDLPSKTDEQPATARMFYTAYFKKSAASEQRPVTFFYNGGPGSSTMWLHMGSFGPKRVVTTDTQHDSAAPYRLINNDYSLLDVSDVVFIDAPGAGFSRIFGKEKEKAFWGMDGDAQAFKHFISRFLTKYNRWNSPKYLFGESYGTPRSAVIAANLGTIDLNGIVLLSAILSFDNSVDGPKTNPGVDQAYAIALPTYAATAYYHHKLPQQPAALEPFLTEVAQFALGDYASALLQGSELSPAKKQAVAQQLHEYTGLPVAYLLKSDLRVSGGAFTKTLALDEETTLGRLDSRYKGPDLNPLSETAEYDPQSNAISSAYTTAINQYLRKDLQYGENETYKVNIYADGFSWDLRHHQPNGAPASEQWGGTNVMPDLAFAMKSNPGLKILLAGGYYDLATPYYQGIFEMHHLPIPNALQANISYRYYEAGHMIYVNEAILKQFHSDVASFIRSTQSPTPSK